MKRETQLNTLIASQEEAKKNNILTPTGIAYLNGLIAARNIAFPKSDPKNKADKK